MSAATRLRVATRGYRGSTTNRRVSIATFGFRPAELIGELWRNIKTISLSIQQVFEITTGR